MGEEQITSSIFSREKWRKDFVASDKIQQKIVPLSALAPSMVPATEMQVFNIFSSSPFQLEPGFTPRDITDIRDAIS